MKKRALLSVSDKTGIVDFAKGLFEEGYEILSTGGTYNALVDGGISAVEVSGITEFPECLDGRVKTLHPKIHGGILAIREKDSHMEELKKHHIGLIDIVAVNLYPFKETVLKEGTTLDEAIENIDIGGPSMIRAAAKNYKYVSVLTDPSDYTKLLDEIKSNGKICPETNFYLSAKAFMHTAHYDCLISEYLKPLAKIEELSDTLTLTYEKVQDMRYGENPQQKAAFYKEVKNTKGLLTNAKQLHGKELSFNNINDANGALMLLKEFDVPAAVACKHAIPCGVAEGESIAEAFSKAYQSDPVSIYGGIVAVNGEVCEKTAEIMSKIFLEIVIAESFSNKALEILTQKKNIRLLELKNIKNNIEKSNLDLKRVSGGIIVQESNIELFHEDELQCVTKRNPAPSEMKDLIFAMKVVKHAKSNAIAIAKNKQSIGIGGGQVSRIWACKQAVEHGKEFFGEAGVKGAVLASDAYFPFADSVEEAYKAGITAVIQPGGSKNDYLSIEFCDAHDMAMVFTNMRHFRH